MKIGFFTDSYFPEIDGVTYTIKLWRERLEQRGHETAIIYPDGDYEPADGEYPVKSAPNPFYPGYRFGLYRRPSTLPDFDLVHCHGPGPIGILGRRYAKKRDLPLVYTHHTPIEEYFDQSVPFDSIASKLKQLYPTIEERFLEPFDVVTASTNRIDRDVDHIQLPVGLNMDFFGPTDEDWYPDRTVIGYSGRTSMEKNVHKLVEIAERLPEYDFVIVGEGPRREDLEADVPDNVTVRDFLPREELPVFYSSIDVFVTASTADTLGLSTLEANACGTPVVAADTAPFDKTIGINNGERFEPGNVDEAVTAIQQCLSTERETRAAVQQYSVTNTIEQIESLYENLANGVTDPVKPLQTEEPLRQ
jgi:1,2-diacylglycerol 3-alpha-glucosyltransferase